MMLRAFLKILAVSTALLCTGVAARAATDQAFVPVFSEDFADAFVLVHDGGFIAYSTNSGPNVPIATSSDLVHWSFAFDASGKQRDALPQLGSWAKRGATWAPEVLQIGERYLLYYAASYRQQNIECIGVAEAADLLGPFVDSRPAPLVCQEQLGGSIDPDAFRDADGQLYLYFKNDGNRVGKSTAIWGQPLAPDGLSLIAQPVALIHDDKPWEHKVVEAPTMVRSPIGYELFFSGAYYGWNDDQARSPYGMGYASCSGPLGPCAKSPDNPLLHSYYDRQAGCLSGPGHQSIFTVGTHAFMSFHAWAATSGCHKADDKRYLYIAPIFWKDGKPQIAPSLR
jgi:beta-xylosidase